MQFSKTLKPSFAPYSVLLLQTSGQQSALLASKHASSSLLPESLRVTIPSAINAISTISTTSSINNTINSTVTSVAVTTTTLPTEMHSSTNRNTVSESSTSSGTRNEYKNGNTSSNTIATLQTEAILPMAPKSPPRWPLRPGVMVHVRNETKKNLTVNRMTLKPSLPPFKQSSSTAHDLSFVSMDSHPPSQEGDVTMSTLLDSSLAVSATTPISSEQQQPQQQPQQQRCANEVTSINEVLGHSQEEAPNVELLLMSPALSSIPSLPITTNDNELTSLPRDRQLKPTNVYQCLQGFMSRLFRRTNFADTTRDSQRSHVGLLANKFWKRLDVNKSEKSAFSVEHRLKGIRCSGSGNNLQQFLTQFPKDTFFFCLTQAHIYFI